MVVSGQFRVREDPQLRPTRNVEIRRVTDMAKQAEPFDKTTFDIAGAKGQGRGLRHQPLELALEVK